MFQSHGTTRCCSTSRRVSPWARTRELDTRERAYSGCQLGHTAYSGCQLGHTAHSGCYIARRAYSECYTRLVARQHRPLCLVAHACSSTAVCWCPPLPAAGPSPSSACAGLPAAAVCWTQAPAVRPRLAGLCRPRIDRPQPRPSPARCVLAMEARTQNTRAHDERPAFLSTSAISPFSTLLALFAATTPRNAW